MKIENSKLKIGIALLAIGYWLFTAPLALAAIPNWGSPLVTCTAGDPSSGIEGAPTKKCESLCDLALTSKKIIEVAITFAVFAIAPLFLLVGGIMLIAAGGSDKMVTTAKSMMKGAVIGAALAMVAFIMVNTVVLAFSLKGIGGFSQAESGNVFEFECGTN